MVSISKNVGWLGRASSLVLDKEMVSAKYLLLHTHGDKASGDLWKVVSEGPKVYSKADMIKNGYPDPSRGSYLVIQIKPVTEPELRHRSWDFRKLKNYRTRRASAFPFTTTLAELMKNKVS